MSKVQIMSVIGSAVPAPLRELGIARLLVSGAGRRTDQRPAHFAARRPGTVATHRHGQSAGSALKAAAPAVWFR